MPFRPLLIPEKRALLPPSSGSSRKPVAKVLNPSAVPAETRIRPSAQDAANASGIEEEEEYEKKYKCTEYAFAVPPQPFLDPPVWEAMLKRKEQAVSRQNEGTSQGGVQSGSETTEQRRRRLEQEAEYGSMAIRGRSSVPRGRARGRGGRRKY
ncbi:uncharacterized protein N7477_000708 [Penicillium maclennaniae]|uniref:uncharacterized protein n=1 Tax=Penicillium maclennaniae TaxID=1343394 RepID=UPI002540B725|nr:uncharacterized protein N7477_000708 [Penicillium maclennaniae]KAJ5684363.1 hypothetical protein N7477_000708 [Penicillium maclennaniae]